VTPDPRPALLLACLVGGACVLYVVARAMPPRYREQRNGALALLTALVFAAALLLFAGPPAVLSTWNPLPLGRIALRADPGGRIVIGIALGLGALVAIYSGRYLSLDRRYELFYPLLLLLTTGLSGMLLATDLFTLYLFCELMSVSAYALVAFRRHTDTAIEAGFKYLIMGSVGTALMLMGISFVYRGRGHLALPGVAVAATDLWTRVGIVCLVVGLAVKSAIVPMHTWLPDAHGRAPSSVSAMLSGIVIQSALYALLKTGLSLGLPARSLGTALIGVAMLNMTVGNALALVQTNTKRLLAYSSIAQLGYIMLSVGLGLRYGLAGPIEAAFLFLLVHATMKALAFLSKGVCHFYCRTTTIEQMRGMGRQVPLVGVTLSVALAGLAGVPPLAGFAGKWFVLSRALYLAGRDPRETLGVYLGLGVFLLNGLLALGYYLPLIGVLFAAPLAGPGREQGCSPDVSAWMAVPLVLLGGLVLAIGLAPGLWLAWMGGVGHYLLSLCCQT